MKAWAILAVFLIVGGFVIIKSNDIDLKQSEDRTDFLYKFARWVYNLSYNIKDLAGYAISMDWIPETEDNLTNMTNST